MVIGGVYDSTCRGTFVVNLFPQLVTEPQISGGDVNRNVEHKRLACGKNTDAELVRRRKLPYIISTYVQHTNTLREAEPGWYRDPSGHPHEFMQVRTVLRRFIRITVTRQKGADHYIANSSSAGLYMHSVADFYPRNIV